MKNLIIIIFCLMLSLEIFAQIKVDQNNNVGIGTETPSTKLHVNGQSLFKTSISLGSYSTSHRGLFINNGGSTAWNLLQLKNNSGEIMTVKGDGKVGIGTTSPLYPLHVVGDVYANNGWFRTSGQKGLYSQTYGVYFYPIDGNYWRMRSNRGLDIRDKNNVRKGVLYHSGNAFGLLDGDHNWSLLIAKDNYTAFRINNNEKMRITNVGNVGIGTENPIEKLHIKGKIRGNQAGGALRIQTDYGYGDLGPKNTGWMHFITDRSKYYFNKSIFVYGSFSAYNGQHFIFKTHTTERMRINKDNGNLGIGTSSPSTKLHVNGSITYVGTSSNASDKRLKSDIQEMNMGLEEVLKLNPVSYKYNGKAGIDNTEDTHIGLIAQDLEKVSPNLVQEFEYIEYEKNEIAVMDADARDEGVPGTPAVENQEPKILAKEKYLSIEESAIKYLLVNAIKEQQQLINDDVQNLEELEENILNFINEKDESIDLLREELSNQKAEIEELKAMLIACCNRTGAVQKVEIDNESIPRRNDHRLCRTHQI